MEHCSNQIDKINQALALLTADVNNIQSQTGGIKTLIEAKEKSVLDARLREVGDLIKVI